MTKEKFFAKTREFFIGRQSISGRFPTAFWPALSLSFILFFFGPLDLSHTAETYVSYTVFDILKVCFLFFAAVFAVMFLILIISGGKLHSSLSSLFAGLALAFYIQGNWLNIDLGTLDGSEIEWSMYGDNALTGLFVFLLIMLIPFLIHYYSRRLWKKYVIFVSALLLIMQAVPLSIMIMQEYKDRPASSTHYVMKKGREFVLGRENIVVFILDQTSPTYIESLKAEYPDVLSPFHDFTSFDNYNTTYFGTFPAAAYLQTHTPYDWEIRYMDWFEQAWSSEDAKSFYSQLISGGWTVRLFSNPLYAAGTLENEYGKISNVDLVDKAPAYTINPQVFRKLIKLSLYRYFPLIMKAPFRIYTGDLNGMKNMSEDEQAWDGIKSVQKYLDRRLQIGDEEKVYVTYHWAGAHPPFGIDEKCKYLQGSTLNKQLAGHFYAISEFIQQMKDYHVYDSSMIIITTDHGYFDDPNSILFVKPAGQRQEEMDHSRAPISQTEFMETIAEAAGLEKGQFGLSFYDIPENEERFRCSYIRGLDPDYPVVPGKWANVIREYCYQGDTDKLLKMIVDNEFKSYFIQDPWY